MLLLHLPMDASQSSQWVVRNPHGNLRLSARICANVNMCISATAMNTYLQSTLVDELLKDPLGGKTTTANLNMPATASSFPEEFRAIWCISNCIEGVCNVYTTR